MSAWCQTNLSRLRSEREAVEALASEEPWFRLERWLFHEGRLCAEGVITAHGYEYAVRLVYPDPFPLVPAWVEPQSDARWSTHQYGTGLLCLPLRPETWIAKATGADVLRGAYDLFIIENPLGEGGSRAPSGPIVGELQAYGWLGEPVLIGRGCLDRIRQGNSVDMKAITWLPADTVWPILLQDADDRRALRRPSEPDVLSLQGHKSVVVSVTPGPWTATDRDALLSAGQFTPETAAFVTESTSGLVLYAGDGAPRAFELQSEGALRRREVFVLPEQAGVRSGRDSASESKRVAIVGAGSVGSKIAESLVRSGLTRLMLVDGDVMLPDNLERHVLDWRDVGFRKVHALRRQLLRIVPGADITVHAGNLNWQRSARTHASLVSDLASSDVIVDATGDAATSLFLGAVADAHSCALVSVAVFDGGVGARIATCLPERDPPFAIGREAFLTWCDQQGGKPPEPSPRPYDALTDDGTPLVADDAAVTATAAHAARVILDILDGDPPPVEAAWLLLGYRKAWVFGGHGCNIHLNVGLRSAPTPEADDPETRAFVQRLMEDDCGEAQLAE